MRNLKVFVSVGCFVLVVFYVFSNRPKPVLDWSQTKTGFLKIESRAVDFELLDRSGRKVRLSDFQRAHGGAPVLVHFWATWCEPCVEEMPLLLQFAEWAKKEYAVSIVAVTSDKTWNDVDAFFKTLGKNTNDVRVKVLLDSTGEITKNFSTEKLPETWFIDRGFSRTWKIEGAQDWMSEAVKSWFREAVKSQ